MDCPANEAEIFCAGSAAPAASRECTPIIAGSGSFANAAQGYCCPGGADAGAVDTGLVDDGGGEAE
jgi:hypothetical protein